MNNIQESTARALGWEYVESSDDGWGDWGDSWWFDDTPQDKLPDPSEPNVYEAVIKLAQDLGGDYLSVALAVVLGIEFDDITLDNYYDALDQFVNADSFDRLIAALWVLGKLDEGAQLFDEAAGQTAENFKRIKLERERRKVLGLCPKCSGEMKPGKALQNELSGIPDFPDGEVSTVSETGPVHLIDCMKCTECGWSIR